MNLNIKITWPAGLWINSTSDIISNTFAYLWYNILTDIEYESRIKGWVNYFDIFVSDENVYLTKYVDIIVAFNLESLQKNIFSLRKNWVIFCNEKLKDKFDDKTKEIISINQLKIISLDISDKYENTYLLWLFAKYFDIEANVIYHSLKEVFGKKWDSVLNANINIFNNVISQISLEKWKLDIKKIWSEKEISYGNKIIAYWAIDAKLEYYSAYPMTPASTILTEIISSKKVTYLQAEDEIAVINSAIWASYTWSRSMVWTSWWGFALMTEALSFAIEAEFPITVVLSQRAWPSTWTPTYHETWDINFALNPTFWDFEHIVLTPSSLEEAYFFAWLSLNLADKYQTIVILLIDKQLSELSWTFENLEKVIVDRWIILDNPPDDYKRYEFNETWVSPRVVVWTKNGDFISSSYEHDEYGATSEDSENKKLMTEKRWKKLENFFKKEGISGFENFYADDVKNGLKPFPTRLIITFSATSYTAKEFVDKNSEYGLVIIKFLKPLDERLLDILKDKEEIIFVENNYSGQLENYISGHFWLRYINWLKISHLRKYDLFPFYIEDFNELKN